MRFQTTHYEVHVMEPEGWTGAIPHPRSRKAALVFAQRIVNSDKHKGKQVRVVKITHAEELIKHHNRPAKAS